MLSNKRKQSAPKPKPKSKSCNICEYTTNEMQELIDHMKCDHNMDEIYPCDHCNFYTNSLWNFQVHVAAHYEKQNCDENNLKIKIDKLKIGKIIPTTSSNDEGIPLSDDQQEEEDDDNDDEEGEQQQQLQHIQTLNGTDDDYQSYIDDDEEDQEQQNDSQFNDDDLSINDQTDNGDYGLDEPLKLNKIDTDNNNKLKTQLQNKIPQIKHNQQQQQQQSMSVVLPIQLPQQQQPERAKRHYNSEVDPARYRKVLEDGITKFACSLCGNTYKWRKSLNKHWKEKHITEQPPPLDAPVTIKLRNSNTTITSASSKVLTQPQQQQQQQQQQVVTSTSQQMPSTLPIIAKQQFPDATTALLLQAYAANWGQFVSQQQQQQQQQNKTMLKQVKPKINQDHEPLDLSVSKSTKSFASSTSSVSSTSSSVSCIKQEQLLIPSSVKSDCSTRTSRRSSMSSLNNDDQHLNLSQSSMQTPQRKSSASSINQNQNINSSSIQSTSNGYNQKLYVCSVCDAKFHVVDHINDHFFKHHYIEYQRELSSKSPPRNTNVAQQNEEWNLSDPLNPLKCIKCDFVGRWPTELQKHAASHSTSRPFKCLICSLTYKWRWDLAKHFDRTHPTFRNPYKKRDRDAARSTLVPNSKKSESSSLNSNNLTSSSSTNQTPTSSSTSVHTNNSDNNNHHHSLRDHSPQSCSSNQSHSINVKPSPPSSHASFDIKQQKQQQSAKPLIQSSTLPGFGPDAASLYAAMMPFLAASAASNPFGPSHVLPPPHLMPSLFLQAAANLSKNASFDMKLPPTKQTPTTPIHHHHQQQQQPSNNIPQVHSDDSSKLLQTSNSNKKLKLNNNEALEKESRNFQCYWCDFRGRWRSEIIQHMRCHHAREKPYRCSACSYASNWKWDVQKHTKKQHSNDLTAKIIEIPDSVLFPDLKDWNFFDIQQQQQQTTTQTSKSVPQVPQINSQSDTVSKLNKSHSTPAVNVNNKTPTNKQNQAKTNESLTATTQQQNLQCQQCPYTACNLSDLRRHLIVHSNEQPYHCCSCDYKSKWKSDVKKHQRILGHSGPILVGKKAMQKVIENLGLDRNSIVNLYGPNIQIIDNKQCKSNEKLIDEEDTLVEFNGTKNGINKRKRENGDDYENNDDDDDEEEYHQIIDDSDIEGDEELIEEDEYEHNDNDNNGLIEYHSDENEYNDDNHINGKSYHSENLSDDDDDDNCDNGSNNEQQHQQQENDERMDEDDDYVNNNNDEDDL